MNIGSNNEADNQSTKCHEKEWVGDGCEEPANGPESSDIITERLTPVNPVLRSPEAAAAGEPGDAADVPPSFRRSG